ncbi:MAG: hypothetical protein P9L92_00965 [Candidatus Electryonea clarkiae]|nr:hypothetical protein [Candidatus Electryonea clarkiae]MDP8289183.1 hypothetical protein [Candidatus Electryonea clarkiae]
MPPLFYALIAMVVLLIVMFVYLDLSWLSRVSMGQSVPGPLAVRGTLTLKFNELTIERFYYVIVKL